MKHSLGGASYNTNYYDLAQSNDKYISKKVAECREMAKAYLTTKKRLKYYSITGNGFIDQYYAKEVEDIRFSFPFTDEEIGWIRTQWIDAYNEGLEEGYKIAYDNDITFDELDAACPIDEINEEVTKMLVDKTEGKFTYISKIDFAPHYRYKIKVLFYNEKDHSLYSPWHFMEKLTDEEYIELLTQRLLTPKQFCYNRLMLSHPQLMQRITEDIHDWHFENPQNKVLHSCLPFIICFTEIEEDAKIILGKQGGTTNKYQEPMDTY